MTVRESVSLVLLQLGIIFGMHVTNMPTWLVVLCVVAFGISHELAFTHLPEDRE